MKFSIVFTVLATVYSMVAPVASAPLAETRATEKRASTGKGYDVGLGACGKTNNNKQPIFAVNRPQWNMYEMPCGKWVTVTHTGNRGDTRGYIEDMCPGWKKGYLDLSPDVFKAFASLDDGDIPISWNAPSTKRYSDDDLVIRAGNPYDFEPEEEYSEYKFGPADALSEDLAELFASVHDLEEADS